MRLAVGEPWGGPRVPLKVFGHRKTKGIDWQRLRGCGQGVRSSAHTLVSVERRRRRLRGGAGS